ncbi:alpha/beta hydrolase [Occultella glacieicola]|uniref:Alpha/beta hydrolase n=1 Tax=Occultella glacieicola TaxID=2518684 RepID=A0ABY2E1R9_9MICO|nr:alpha/beta hydrolase [Occultella glacieicola]TDE92526.1 alpha/beta hydrolase [Occultella glacieicola]
MDILMIPGFWLDGASWEAVVPHLERAGHACFPLTLPGMESRDTDRSQITLADHIAAVVAEIDAHPEAPVVLVGHSGGGAVAYGAVDARPDRVARVIYVDSGPSGEGAVINDEYPTVGGELPLPDWSVFEDADLVGLDDALRAEFRARAIPTPAHVAQDPMHLTDERRLDVPATVIACEFPSAMLKDWMAQDHPFVRELGRLRSVEYRDLPTGHWPQFSRPDDLGATIVDALATD